MFLALVEQIERDCVAKLSAGEPLDRQELRGFRILLEARELSGRRLLGTMAGPDPCIDTVTGRCGQRPRFDELA